MNSHHYQSVLPDNSSPLMRAVEKAFRAQLEAVNEPFPQLLNPALTPAQFLSVLASEVGVKDWFESDTVSEQRSIVGNGLIIQKEAGTRAGLKRAAESIGVDATVTPWFNTEDGKPYEFYIDAYVEDDETLDALAFERLSARIFHHKSERDLWLVTFKHDPILGSACAAPVIRTRKRWVSTNIVPLHVAGITISPTNAIVYEGAPVSVSATVEMSDGTTTHDVRFESSDVSVVTVDAAGLVTFVSEGNASVYAISTFNDISSAECLVVSHEALAPVSVAISGMPASLAPGEVGQLIATVLYNDNTSVSSLNKPNVVGWSSSDESIITVDANGNYSAVASGSVTITATSTEDADISDSVALESIEDYERFSIVVGEGLYGPDTLTSVGVFLYSPDHPDYKDTFGDFSSENWPSGEPIISITSKAQLMWRRRSSDVVAYFSARSKWPKWRDWDGVTVTLTHGSESISQSLTFGNYYIEISEEGIPVHEFLTARIGQTVDVELSEYVATAEEKATARLHTITLLNE
ncbi:phage tail protein I [Vibrio parahaemolyticus]|nr:phage tail protein I [Vibrio parahaemolyticus]